MKNLLSRSLTGLGTLSIGDKLKYEGDFKDGHFHGEGKLTIIEDEELPYYEEIGDIQVYTHQTTYVGGFQNGLFDGYGSLNSDCLSYDGYFKTGDFHGIGKSVQKMHYYTPQKIYEGNFENGLYSGYGQLYFENGSYFNGLFKDGDFIGGIVFINGISYMGTVKREVVSYQWEDEELLLININNIDYEILFDKDSLDSYERGPIGIQRSWVNDL